MKLKKRKETINIKFDKDPNDKHEGWYERIENNGWRPINDKNLTPYDQIESDTSLKKETISF